MRSPPGRSRGDQAPGDHRAALGVEATRRVLPLELAEDELPALLARADNHAGQRSGRGQPAESGQLPEDPRRLGRQLADAEGLLRGGGRGKERRGEGERGGAGAGDGVEPGRATAGAGGGRARAGPGRRLARPIPPATSRVDAPRLQVIGSSSTAAVARTPKTGVVSESTAMLLGR